MCLGTLISLYMFAWQNMKQLSWHNFRCHQSLKNLRAHCHFLLSWISVLAHLAITKILILNVSRHILNAYRVCILHEQPAWGLDEARAVCTSIAPRRQVQTNHIPKEMRYVSRIHAHVGKRWSYLKSVFLDHDGKISRIQDVFTAGWGFRKVTMDITNQRVGLKALEYSINITLHASSSRGSLYQLVMSWWPFHRCPSTRECPEECPNNNDKIMNRPHHRGVVREGNGIRSHGDAPIAPIILRLRKCIASKVFKLRIPLHLLRRIYIEHTAIFGLCSCSTCLCGRGSIESLGSW